MSSPDKVKRRKGGIKRPGRVVPGRKTELSHPTIQIAPPQGFEAFPAAVPGIAAGYLPSWPCLGHHHRRFHPLRLLLRACSSQVVALINRGTLSTACCYVLLLRY
nr:uncharacterized protein LOC127297892 [Lolium perenne]